MRQVRALFAGLVATLVLLAASPVDADEQGRVVFRFGDPRITESSGLVDTGRAMFTVNDSGNAPLLFRVDPDTGRTTGTIRYAARAVDVEALAPAPGGGVWVGDIGDNTRSRPHIDVYRVDGRAGSTGASAHYRLKYPDGAHDAETLIVTRGGEVYVVTKALTGAAVYRATHLSERKVAVMSRVADVGGLLTDGALLPDGRHVLLRNYGEVSVHTFPGFEPIGTMALPVQQQGEALSVGPGGRIRISSEGLHAPVLEVRLTSGLVRAMGRVESGVPGAPVRSGAPAASASPQSTHQPGTRDAAGDAGAPAWVWLVGGLGVLVAVLGSIGVARRRTH